MWFRPENAVHCGCNALLLMQVSPCICAVSLLQHGSFSEGIAVHFYCIGLHMPATWISHSASKGGVAERSDLFISLRLPRFFGAPQVRSIASRL